MFILPPLALAATPMFSGSAGAGSGPEYVLTASPKEVWVAGAVGTTMIDIDLGAAADVDSFYLGFTNASAAATWAIYRQSAAGVDLVALQAAQTLRRAEGLGPRHPALAVLGEPVNSRYFRIVIVQTGAAALEIGRLMIGLAFQMPHEFGGGRGLIDTGAKEALSDGGFGIGDGVVKATLRWSFIDLSDDQLRTLWALAKASGERRPIVACEDPANTVGRSERIHYGLFDRFETYDRQSAGLTRWAISMTDWA